VCAAGGSRNRAVSGSHTVVEIKQVAKIEWDGKQRFWSQKIVKKNLGCYILNKNKLLN
jgi:hypothetical protein